MACGPRKIDRLVKQLGSEGLTKDRISSISRALDDQVDVVRFRPRGGAYPVSMGGRQAGRRPRRGRAVSEAVVIAYAAHDTGVRRADQARHRGTRVGRVRSCRSRNAASLEDSSQSRTIEEVFMAATPAPGVPVAAIYRSLCRPPGYADIGRALLWWWADRCWWGRHYQSASRKARSVAAEPAGRDHQRQDLSLGIEVWDGSACAADKDVRGGISCAGSSPHSGWQNSARPGAVATTSLPHRRSASWPTPARWRSSRTAGRSRRDRSGTGPGASPLAGA